MTKRKFKKLVVMQWFWFALPVAFFLLVFLRFFDRWRILLVHYTHVWFNIQTLSVIHTHMAMVLVFKHDIKKKRNLCFHRTRFVFHQNENGLFFKTCITCLYTIHQCNLSWWNSVCVHQSSCLSVPALMALHHKPVNCPRKYCLLNYKNISVWRKC